MELREQRISDALYLLSRDNYWDSLKIVYDILMNDLFLYAKIKMHYKQHIIEERHIEAIQLLYEFLSEKKVIGTRAIVSEIRLLTIFLNNFSRETLKENTNNFKIKVLVLNLIGLLKFIDKNSTGTSYIFGQINSDLINEINNNLSEEIYESTDLYFKLWLDIKVLFNEDLWIDVEKWRLGEWPTLFSEDELGLLTAYKSIIIENQFALNRNARDEITGLEDRGLQYDELYEKAIKQYYFDRLYRLMDAFRKVDKSGGKSNKNIYKKELEAGFHKNIYPYLAEGKGFDLALSEHNSGRQRHDIVLYDLDTNLSAIIELKVNDLTSIQTDLGQLIDYLLESTDKPHLYMSTPNIGVLAIYYIGKEELSEIDIVELLPEIEGIVKISDNFYHLVSEEANDTPILIAIFNGK